MYVCSSCAHEYIAFRAICDWCDAGPNTLRLAPDPTAPTIEPPPIDPSIDAPADDSPTPPPRPRPPLFVRRKAAAKEIIADPTAVRLCDLEAIEYPRRSCGIAPIDRLLGGGIVDSEGTIYVAWGDGGSGKSTLLTELLMLDTKEHEHAGLYAAGEEAGSRVAVRAKHVGIEVPRNLFIEEGRDIDRVFARARSLRVRSMVLDSLQVFVPEEHKTAEALVRLIALARELCAVFWIVNHATKDGQFYGTNKIKHEFDSLFRFNRVWTEDPQDARRTIATKFVDVGIDTKNRFGEGPESPPARFAFEHPGRLVAVPA